jgi:tetratricopeptide (TPR) repeat protein
MTEQGAFDRDNIKLQPLAPPMGLMEQFNLPPAMIAFIRRNQRAIRIAVTVVVLLAIALSSYSAYRDYRAAQASAALDAALIAKQDKRQMLDKVVSEYGATGAALWAQIELALLEEREGQRAQAISRLEAINAGLSAKSLLKPLALNKLAGLYEDEKQFDKALVAYADLATREAFASEAYRAMGRVNELLGKKEEAAAMYGKYLEAAAGQAVPGQSDPVREMVQSRLNQLKK